MLIATTADGCPIGQIRFDRQPVSVRSDAIEASVDLSLDPCVRGIGISTDLVRLGLQELEKFWGPKIEAVAQVFSSNVPSNACFSRAGFRADSGLLSDGPSKTRTVNCWRWRSSASD